MPPNKSPISSDPKLVNNLTVADARHIVACEGGELTIGETIVEILTSALVAGAIARAIWVGNATAWHLFLPMAAQYIALIFALPALYLFFRHPDLRREAISSVRFMAFFAVVGGIALAVQGRGSDVPWQQRLIADYSRAWLWIYDAQMHWPILLAVAATLLALPRRVRNLYVHGPPFYGVSLGCAMRLVIPLLGCFLIPFIASNAIPIVWVLWAIIVLADLLALTMHWDLQRRLRKLDSRGPSDPRATLKL